MGLGFKKEGFRLAGAWDFDKYAVMSYGHNVSPKVKQVDVTEMESEDVPYADVWTFGAPCQAFSVAGKQLGMMFKCGSCGHEETFEGELIIDRHTYCSECGGKSKPKDQRGIMFFEIMRLLKYSEDENRPPMILLENVKGIKKFLNVVEKEYEKRGYKMVSTLYNSKYWGVPQNRERYFIAGVREDIEKEFEFTIEQTDFVPKLSSILEDEVEEKFYIAEEKAQKVIQQALSRLDKLDGVRATITPDRVDKRQNGRRAKENELEMFTLTAQDLHGVIQNVGNTNPSGNGMNGNVYSIEGVSPCLTTNKGEGIKVIGRLDMKGHDVIRRVYDPEGVSPTLTTSEGGHRQPKILEPVLYNRKDGIVKTIEQSPTLSAADWRGLNQNQSKAAVVEGYRVRKLTPREYARLQGFPESFEFVVSNTQLYKQFGNAVTVNVSAAIAKKISEFLTNSQS